MYLTFLGIVPDVSWHFLEGIHKIPEIYLVANWIHLSLIRPLWFWGLNLILLFFTAKNMREWPDYLLRLCKNRGCLGRHWHHSHDKMDQAFPLCFCILQAIKNWMMGRPGNEASIYMFQILYWVLERLTMLAVCYDIYSMMRWDCEQSWHAVAVDMSPAQNALMELKLAAITHLSYEDFLCVLGETEDSNSRR